MDPTDTGRLIPLTTAIGEHLGELTTMDRSYRALHDEVVRVLHLIDERTLGGWLKVPYKNLETLRALVGVPESDLVYQRRTGRTR